MAAAGIEFEGLARAEQMLLPLVGGTARNVHIHPPDFIESHFITALEVGKKADFAVFEQDLTKIDPLKISENKVVYTIFDGKIVYEG